jgi:hypothetical protein
VKSPQDRLRRGEFRRCRLSFDREQLPARSQQPRRPARQPVKRRDRARSSDICAHCPGKILCSCTDDPDVLQPQFTHTFLKERATPQHRFHQDHPERRPYHRDHQPGKSGTRSDIDYFSALRQQLIDNSAIEEMAVPEPFGFPRADEPTLHTLGRQQPGVFPRLLQRGTEDACRFRRRERYGGDSFTRRTLRRR